MFQIYRIDPWHCPITDGLVGSKTIALPMAYHNQAYAEKLSGRLEEEEYQHCGDSRFVAAPYGKGPPSRRSAFFDELTYD